MSENATVESAPFSFGERGRPSRRTAPCAGLCGPYRRSPAAWPASM